MKNVYFTASQIRDLQFTLALNVYCLLLKYAVGVNLQIMKKAF